MYRTLLVDDEHVIRQGLKKIIDWESLGFEVVDEAENGIVAFEKIMSQKPDLVLLDIKMPGYDGVTLLKKLRQEGNACKVIFLTGFAEFEYAKNAIALGVEAFLTKPFDEQELKQVLIEIAKRLDASKQIEQRLASQEKLKEKQMYRRLLFGEKVDTETIDLSNTFCVVDVQSEEEIHTFNAFFDDFQEKHPSVVCLLIAGNWTLIFRNMSLTRIRVAMYDLNNQMKRSFGERFFISVGRHVTGHHELYKSFEDVKILGQKWFLSNDETIIYQVDQSGQTSGLTTLDSDLLYGYLEVGNKEGIDSFLKDLKKHFMDTTINISRVKGLCSNMLLIILEKVKSKEQIQSSQLPDSGKVASELYAKNNLNELMDTMTDLINDVYELIHSGSRDSTMYRILDYIDTHYDKNIKLERLGVIFGYNSSYLGTIFKQHTGMSFKNYLDSVRIEMAKKLLAEGTRKVYEVAELVGYNNVDYFHSKFKKYEHMSPKKYQMTYKEKR